jgi:hypothetical protein
VAAGLTALVMAARGDAAPAVVTVSAAPWGGGFGVVGSGRF